MMRNFLRAAACLLCVAAFGAMKVGVMTNSRPFAWEDAGGKFHGASVAIWEEVARAHDLRFSLVPAGPNVKAALDKLDKKEFDVLVGPISVTEERHRSFDFSRPYFLNHLSVALPSHVEGSKWRMLGRALWDPLSYILPVLLCVILFMTLCFYFFDRNVRNRKVGVTRGLMDSCWEVIIILVQGELLEDTKHPGKRVLVLFWLVSSIGLLSVLIGTITSSMTIFDDKIERSHRLVRSDLEAQKVVVVKGSVSEKEARRAMALPVGVSTRDEAVRLLVQRKVFGMIDDFLLLKSLQAQGNPIRVTRFNMKNDEVAFAFRKGAPVIRSVDTTLLQMQDSGVAETVCRPYLGAEAVLCLL